MQTPRHNRRPHRLMTCYKKKYDTYYSALRVLKKLRVKHKVKRNHRKTKRLEKRIYKCDICGGYHFTKQKER